LQPPIEAEPDHPTQPLPMPGEQLGQGPLVPAFDADQQVTIVLFALAAHDASHFRIIARRLGLSTGYRWFSEVSFSCNLALIAASGGLLEETLAGLWTIDDRAHSFT
jgi:hypothetical protein